MNSFQVVSIAALIIMQLVTPLLFIYQLGFKRRKSKIDSIIEVFTAWSFFIFVFLAGQWSFLPYSIRYILLLLFILATIKVLTRLNEIVLWEKKNLRGWINFSVHILISLIFIFVCVEIIRGFSTKEEGIELSYPLKDGFISQGGNSTIINYHNADSTAQQYALDITQLNIWGLRASGFFPNDLNKYEIFGDTVYSPCDCEVVHVKDGLEDIRPGSMDPINIAGNHIILEFKGNLILMTHLMKNSILVSPNDYVRQGQPIARVGNSGQSTEPHLHIHAIKGTDINKIFTGDGIPIYFDGKFLIRNDRFKKR